MDGGANYINEENLELPINRPTFGKRNGKKPFGKQNPLSTREDIDLADLGKPASQIFLEHIQIGYENHVSISKIVDEQIVYPQQTDEDRRRVLNAPIATQTTRSSFTTRPQTALLPRSPSSSKAAGGSNKKTYKIKTDNSDKKSKRKYIRKSNEHWYLDEHRGQYRYSEETRTEIYLL
jgi:hypothetical protein